VLGPDHEVACMGADVISLTGRERCVMLKVTLYHQCPGCASEHIGSVRRRGILDHLARLVLGWRVYGCLSCGRRFYDRRVRRF
jgi:hypothetical protein